MSVGVSELKWPAAVFVHVVCIPPYSRPARPVGGRGSSHINGADTKKPKRSHEAMAPIRLLPYEERGRTPPVTPAYLGHIAPAPVSPLWKHAALRPVLVCISARTWGIIGSNINARPPVTASASSGCPEWQRRAPWNPPTINGRIPDPHGRPYLEVPDLFGPFTSVEIPAHDMSHSPSLGYLHMQAKWIQYEHTAEEIR